LSGEFETQPTVEQLREKTEIYIKENNVGVPVVSWSVSFEQLSKSEEYKHLALLERVSLFDTVSVEFPALGVSATARAVRIVYDVIADRVNSVTLGSVRANIADTIANQSSVIEQGKQETASKIRKAQLAATAWLTNGKGYAYFRKDEFGNIIDILFMDTQDAETAVNVMRVGQSGIGFSHNGVNGPYESAWTIDGHFVADFITSGTLNANLVKAGVITSNNGTIKIDLINNEVIVETASGSDKGRIKITSGGMIGYKLDENTGSYVQTLLIQPGVGNRLTMVQSVNAGLSLGVSALGNGVGQPIFLGDASNPLVIAASTLNLIEKSCSWVYSSELGKYVLCGS
jgi:phage-related protein